jgi:hypothetical protein
MTRKEPNYNQRKAYRARKAWLACGKTQMVCAVELGIGLSTFRHVLAGGEIMNYEKRQKVEAWIEANLPKEE